MPKKDGRHRKTPRIFDKTKPPKANLSGQRFDKLTVIEWAGKSNLSLNVRNMADFWVCQCDCNNPDYNPITVDVRSLRSGNTTSCGCKKRDHQLSKHPLFLIWCGMIARCDNPKRKSYTLYGARGITVCERWKTSFKNFCDDMGERPSKNHSLERVDNNLGYSPENCVWATPKQQARNTRRNRFITWQEETKTLAEWVEDPRLARLGITSHLIVERLGRGWDIDKAMATPPANGRTIPITFQGETLSMLEWSRKLGATANIVSRRIREGWTTEEAVTIPLGQQRQPGRLSRN